MTEREILKRKVQLKNQALRLIQIERDKLRHGLNLFKLRDFLQKRIQRDFDLELLAQLDAVQYLLDSFNLGGRPRASIGECSDHSCKEA